MKNLAFTAFLITGIATSLNAMDKTMDPQSIDLAELSDVELELFNILDQQLPLLHLKTINKISREHGVDKAAATVKKVFKLGYSNPSEGSMTLFHHIAQLGCNPKIVEALLEAVGKNAQEFVLKQSNSGLSPLDLALLSRNNEIADLFTKAAGINQQANPVQTNPAPKGKRHCVIL